MDVSQANNKPAGYVFEGVSVDSLYYNYFFTPTQAINYILAAGW
jgi:hypothetical protein